MTSDPSGAVEDTGRTVMVSFRVSDAERSQLRTAAREAGMSLSDHLRRVALPVQRNFYACASTERQWADFYQQHKDDGWEPLPTPRRRRWWSRG